MKYLIHLHDATHLHYDLRLESDGVMHSWAIPKGVSSDPKVLRLAVKVGTHSLEYNKFEGSILPGNYGAGTVMIWDRGTFSVERNSNRGMDEDLFRDQLNSGSIKIIIKGKKLKGSWHLFKLNGSDKNWMIKKGVDKYINLEFNDLSVKSNKSMEEIRLLKNYKK